MRGQRWENNEKLKVEIQCKYSGNALGMLSCICIERVPQECMGSVLRVNLEWT